MKTVYVFFADGFEEIEALTAVDVLRRAGAAVTMVSVGDEAAAVGAHGVSVQCDARMGDGLAGDADLLVLPGGMPGASTLAACEGLRGALARQVEAGRPVAAICAAPMVLGQMGLLRGKRVTCYPGFEPLLEGAVCTSRPVEQDGSVITGRGPGASMAFALKLVEQLYGKSKADELAGAMCVAG